MAGAPQRSQRLIVSLDVPADQAPEYLCIVSESRSCPEGSEDSNGQLIHEAGCATRELSDLQDVGSLPADLSLGDVAIGTPARQTMVRHYDNRPETVGLDADLIGALQSVSRSASSRCDEMHEGCTPKVRLSAFAKSGRIICGRDGAVAPSAHNGRVAILALSYHEGESRSGVQKVELRGTSATLFLQQELVASNFAFAQVIGGDYAFSSTTSIGTNERIIVELHPRCTLFGAELPRHALTAPLVKASISLDEWGKNPAFVNMATCAPNVRRNTLPISIPYLEGPGTKRLVVSTGIDQDPLVLEATWSSALPPKLLGLAHRRFEFVWRRDCLSGTWPASERSSRDASWSFRCPRASVEGLPGCIIMDQPNTAICKYRCEVPDSSPALTLPLNVQFDRIRAQGAQDQVVYGWQDIISFAGQELRSFVAPADRAVALEFADPKAWQDRSGDTLDGVRITAPGGSFENVDLTSQGGRELLPPWIVVSAPHITCSSRLRVAISGASTYGERAVAVAGGRVVLDDPYSFRPHWHPRFLIGGGTLGVPSARSAVPFVPRHSEPYVTVGGAAEMYIDDYPASVEFRVLFDITKTSFFENCLNTKCLQDSSTHGRAWYTRSNFGASFFWWVSRRLHVGAGGALGIGVPLFDEDDAKVGAFQLSVVTELLDVQARLGGNAWLDVAVGVRWGEEHNYYFRADLFAGSPPPLESVRYISPFVTARIRL
jgi:hypothetical protein